MHSNRRRARAATPRLALCLVLTSASACAGGEPAGPLFPPAPSGDVELESLEASLDNIQRYILTPACATAGCHDAQTQAGLLDLSNADASYDGLVGADGEGVAAANRVAAENRWLRVKPGDPERSFLYRKLELPGVGEGGPMPVGPDQISEPYMHWIHIWIEDGAPR